ncbi:MAG TPA: phosphatase, partial [Lachnospiraceae bacterium]|nr:phosphatase [Lachnospiraceae bacterium]
FDMDGTLLDSMGCWQHLGEAYLLSRGIAPERDLDQALAAMSMRESAVWMKKNYGLQEDPERIVADILKSVEERYRMQAPLKPGVRKFLDKCRAERIPMCVVTATPKRYAVPALKRQGVLELFQFVLDCEELPGGKHRPDVYDQASTRLGVPTEFCVVFEDAAHAQQTASRAGYYVIGVDDLSEKIPVADRLAFCDRFIYSFEELSLRDGVLTGGEYGNQGSAETF